MTPTQETHLKVLRQLEENPDITQRELAEALGVSLGKVNYCLKALIEKGFQEPQAEVRLRLPAHPQGHRAQGADHRALPQAQGGGVRNPEAGNRTAAGGSGATERPRTMNALATLQQKIAGKTALIGIVGLGYVGLPLSLRFAEVGFKVIGFDIDPEKPRLLEKGESYIRHLGNERVRAALEKGFEATTDFNRAAECDALILCVPTPLDEHREPDISFVTNTMESLLGHLKAGQLIALESTSYPGTTEEELKPRIESVGLEVGKDCFLVYSPEREDPGNADYSTHNIPKVVGGMTESCLQAGVALYSAVIDQVVPVSSTRVAEMTKLLENIHRAVNIGLVNEMKVVADKMGIDIYEVIDAAATKPFGFVPYYPGPGLGGHCIPIDPFYLTWKAREYGVHTRFIELAGEINSAMPAWVVGKVGEALNSRHKSINGSRIRSCSSFRTRARKSATTTPMCPFFRRCEDIHLTSKAFH
jgi:UDP-N-acetyl-D-glucosamine dehydrogenase